MFVCLQGITILSKSIPDQAKAQNYPVTEENGLMVLQSPDGYKFYIENKDPNNNAGTVIYMCLIALHQ